ncbi:hypothetical protein R9C00_21050 [Flammeovirgaceae bacterium SG7u.111]|nr:hypothetical protein [Flammeovirgaceae bacterium SG7u.132]WPO34190.1 hypothetical protein R9C00_21050 [Flammeovirgaceae bacterium SG7u.111]
MNKLTQLILLLACIHFCHAGYSQESQGSAYPYSSEGGVTSLGFGIGLPYGAFGIRLGTNITNGLNVFGGAGYQMAGLGYNVGLRKEFKSRTHTQFFLSGMYGTNGVITVEGLDEYDKLYRGATVGLGIKLNSKSSDQTYWDLGLLLPFRPSQFYDDYDKVKNDPRIEGVTNPWPILITAGYNFNF